MSKYTLGADDNKRLDTDFVHHAPRGDQPQRYQLLRDAARTLAQLILENSPRSREQSLALTKLEETMFWANASIARNE
jgi:hypothetical protein